MIGSTTSATSNDGDDGATRKRDDGGGDGANKPARSAVSVYQRERHQGSRLQRQHLPYRPFQMPKRQATPPPKDSSSYKSPIFRDAKVTSLHLTIHICKTVGLFCVSITLGYSEQI
jgi:hypothetical protein